MFNIAGWNCFSRSTTVQPPVYFTYNVNLISGSDADDALATIATSAFFNDVADMINTNDLIYIIASDGIGTYKFTSENGATPVTIAAYPSIATGSIVNADISASAAIAFSKLAALTSANVLVGNGSNVATSVAVSGAVAISNAGVVRPGNVAVAQTAPGLPVVFMINTAGGATADTDVVITQKVRVLNVQVINRAAGTASDTITVKNSATAITDAISISGADKTIARAATIDDASWEIAASGTLRITETDGGGSDSPATTVIVTCVAVA
jgi:hypothetical protein